MYVCLIRPTKNMRVHINQFFPLDSLVVYIHDRWYNKSVRYNEKRKGTCMHGIDTIRNKV